MKTMIVVAFILVMVSVDRAQAHDCPTVRAHVAQHGAKAAIAWARRQGYSMFEIAPVRARCFGK
jgi:hypothetical protein